MLVPSPSHWAALVASCGKGNVASHVLDFWILRGNWEKPPDFGYMKKQEHHSLDWTWTCLEHFRILFGKTKWVEWGKWKLMVDPNPSFDKFESLSKYDMKICTPSQLNMHKWKEMVSNTCIYTVYINTIIFNSPSSKEHVKGLLENLSYP